MAKRSVARYHEPDESNAVWPTLTISRVRKLSKKRQIAVAVQWFNENYEDPVHRTPYESAEGGYIYIWGGPYDARDVLGNEFGGLLSDEVIEAAIEEVQKDGTFLWTSAERDTDYQVGEERGEISSTDLASGDAREVLRRIEDVEKRLADIDKAHPGIGHNNPPAPIEEFPLTTKDRADLREATQLLRYQAQTPQPDPVIVGQTTEVLRSKASRIGEWLALRGNKAADSFADTLGKAAALGVGYLVLQLQDSLMSLISAATEWFHSLIVLF